MKIFIFNIFGRSRHPWMLLLTQERRFYHPGHRRPNMLGIIYTRHCMAHSKQKEMTSMTE